MVEVQINKAFVHESVNDHYLLLRRYKCNKVAWIYKAFFNCVTELQYTAVVIKFILLLTGNCQKVTIGHFRKIGIQQTHLKIEIMLLQPSSSNKEEKWGNLGSVEIENQKKWMNCF